MSALDGRPFWKMTGSGNDFVFIDARACHGAPDTLETADSIQAICRQHLGVGADGVVFLHESSDAAFAIRYYNADGSAGALCGNASLCTAQLAVRIGLAPPDIRFDFMAGSGPVSAVGSLSGPASVRLAPVMDLETAAPEHLESPELQVGYAMVGVPHLVLLVPDVDQVRVDERGPVLRRSAIRPAGANVNFVSRSQTVAGGWRIRTFERGVEAETYACGTGSVASAALVQAWFGRASGESVALETRSGKTLAVMLPENAAAAPWSELTGEGRLVFDGVLRAVTG